MIGGTTSGTTEPLPAHGETSQPLPTRAQAFKSIGATSRPDAECGRTTPLEPAPWPARAGYASGSGGSCGSDPGAEVKFALEGTVEQGRHERREILLNALLS